MMGDIKVIFEKMLKEHVSIVQKNQEMFHKQEQSIQRLDNLSKDINESLEFSQNEYDDKFKNMGDKTQKLEQKINLMKEELHGIQTTKPSG